MEPPPEALPRAVEPAPVAEIVLAPDIRPAANEFSVELADTPEPPIESEPPRMLAPAETDDDVATMVPKYPSEAMRLLPVVRVVEAEELVK